MTCLGGDSLFKSHIYSVESFESIFGRKFILFKFHINEDRNDNPKIMNVFQTWRMINQINKWGSGNQSVSFSDFMSLSSQVEWCCSSKLSFQSNWRQKMERTLRHVPPRWSCFHVSFCLFDFIYMMTTSKFTVLVKASYDHTTPNNNPDFLKWYLFKIFCLIFTIRDVRALPCK